MSWFSALSLRTRALVTGCVISGSLIAVASTVPVPYAAYGPGVTYDVLGSINNAPVISITGDEVPASVGEQVPGAGHLNMTTISVTDGLTLFGALGMWASGNFAIVPREIPFPPNRTVEEVNQINADLFTESQSAAEISALRHLDYPEVTYAGTIPEDSPSFGVLSPQDRITELDGVAVTDLVSLRALLADTTPGQVLRVTVLRDGQELEKKVTLGVAKDENGQALDRGALGIVPQERPVAPFDIAIAIPEVGGSSAGLMFTLGLIDRLTPGDLTSGHFIAGTGEIPMEEVQDSTVSPKVHAIGGILLKMIAARNVGATVFLVPAGNCAEAVTRIPDGLMLVKVDTLEDATKAMQTLADGGTPPSC